MKRRLDHLVVPVNNLAAAAARLDNAGFIVTPQADHPFGTSNRLVVFADSYLELVGLTRPELVPESGFAREVAAFLEKGEGVSHVVVASDDAAADNTSLVSQGLAVGAVFSFSRPAPRCDGTTVTASFSLAMSAATTEVGAFFCSHEAPEAVWHSCHLGHRNGATSIVAVNLDGPPPEMLRSLDVGGVEFGADDSRVTTDGRYDPVRLGKLLICGLAAADACS